MAIEVDRLVLDLVQPPKRRDDELPLAEAVKLEDIQITVEPAEADQPR